MSELRQDPITHDWVIINPERAKRPDDAGAQPSLCPFCPGNEHLTPEPTDCFMDGERWSVRAVPNKFPALDTGRPMARLAEPGSAGWRRLPGYGYHEVIVESPDHGQSLATLPQDQVRKVVAMYRRRQRGAASGSFPQSRPARRNEPRASPLADRRDPGGLAGDALAPFRRSRVFRRDGKLRALPMLEKELEAGARIVDSSDRFVAFTPYASRVPYHIQIVPRRHCSTFLEIEIPEVEALAVALSRALGALHRLLGDPDYNLVLVTPPLDQLHRLASHWFIDVLPRITTPAGFELGSRIVVNIHTPEQAAAELRARAAGDG